MKMLRNILAPLLLAFACLNLTGCFGVIDQGNVGVETKFGQINPQPVTGFYTSLLSTVTEYTTKETNVELTGLQPQAGDKMTVQRMDVTINYMVNGATLPNFQSRFAGMSGKLEGDDFIRPGYIMVQNLANSSIMTEVAKFNADALNTNRQALEGGIKRELQKRLDEKFQGFTVTSVVVKTIQNDPSVQQSIRDNVTATNRLNTAKALVEVRTQEALANEKLAQSFTPAFLQHEYNQALLACAESKTCTLIIDGSASGKVLNLGK